MEAGRDHGPRQHARRPTEGCQVNAAEITALCTGIPAVIAAVTALIYAVKAKGSSQATLKALTAHMTGEGQHP
jgi:hypothetical protein